MLAKVVSYGGNSVRYALDKEKAKVVNINHLPENITATAIWHRMKHHCILWSSERTKGRPLENFMVAFVISPSKEESAKFSMDDWNKLQDEVLEVIDSIDLSHNKRKSAKSTNFRNSMNVAGLHLDSKSGITHLHIDCCRVDIDGKTNDVHDIHNRAMMAAEIINRRHGWKLPAEIREGHREEINKTCMSILSGMPIFDVNMYFMKLKSKGYEVNLKQDSKGNLHGYTVRDGASFFKASELGVGRNLMSSKLEDTWYKMHINSINQKAAIETSAIQSSSCLDSSKSNFDEPINKAKSTILFTTFKIEYGKDFIEINVPASINHIFTDVLTMTADDNLASQQNVVNVALLLFGLYTDAALNTSVSCGGGGSLPPQGFRRRKDEIDSEWAFRCAGAARSMCKPRTKYKRGR